MSQIVETFQRLQKAGRKALMPYLTLGYPQLESALELVPALVEGGADLIELGVPFSDPLADGATIQAASQRALSNGMTLALCLEQVAELRARGVRVPLVLMGYYNPILQMGIESFARRARQAGADGAIVPDLPPEEADFLQEALCAQEIDLIYLLAPTSDDERVRQVIARSSGFLYLVSLVGVTGARDRLPPGLEAFCARVRSARVRSARVRSARVRSARVRSAADLPIAVGFGIGTPEQAGRVASIADGVIVGSALIRAIGAAVEAGEDTAAAAQAFVASLRAGMDAASYGQKT
jgi:tryptophan synthase alpha chain